MKTLLTLLAFFSFCGILFSQEEEEMFASTELTIQITNAPYMTVYFDLIPIGANWAKTSSSGCNILIYNNTITYSSSLTADSSGYVICAHNGFQYRYYYDDNSTQVSQCAQYTAGIKPIRNGFYKMNVIENDELKAFVYFDWRDIGFLKETECNDCPGGNDLTIRYDGSTEGLGLFDNYNSNPFDDPDLLLNDGEIITWADWKCNDRDNLNIWWNNNLVILTSGNNPKLRWGPHLSFQATNYKIYRAVSSTPLGHPEIYASLIATVNSSTYEYIDGDISLTANGNYIYYYVKAYNGSYSGATNKVL